MHASLETQFRGEMWNKLKDQKKTGEYDKLAEVDKERYYSEKEAMMVFFFWEMAAH